jgi:hypothetical protein
MVVLTGAEDDGSGRYSEVNARRSSRFQCRAALRLLTRGSAAAARRAAQGRRRRYRGARGRARAAPFIGARAVRAWRRPWLVAG